MQIFFSARKRRLYGELLAPKAPANTADGSLHAASLECYNICTRFEVEALGLREFGKRAHRKSRSLTLGRQKPATGFGMTLTLG
jgi:hypothetical protein